MPDAPAALIPASGGGLDAGAVRTAVDGWISHPAFLDLTERFEWEPSTDIDLTARLEHLEGQSVAWDFRGGKERNLAAKAQLDSDLSGRVMEAARHLGLRDAFATPAHDRYDHCLVLGGLVRACVLRPEHAAHVASRGVAFTEVTALGAYRELAGDEPDLAAAAGIGGVRHELSAMDAGVRRAFSLGTPDSVGGEDIPDDLFRSWTVRRYTGQAGAVTVIAAPSGAPETRRANTPETYAWWADNVARLSSTDRILLVTSSIYVPYQHADAVRMFALPYGCAVETIGVPHDITGGMPPQPFGAQQYLQEMRSTLRAFRDLLRALPPG